SPSPGPRPGARPIPPPAANVPAPVPAVEAFPGATTPAAPAATSREVDVAYGAYQRGYYLTAFIQATKRIEAQGDMRSMTLLGELYANGFGMPQDDKKAAEWYRLADERGARARPCSHLPCSAWSAALAAPIGKRRRGCSLPPPSSATSGRPTISACSISKASCSRRTSHAPPNCSAPPRRQAVRRRNTRLP